MQGLKEWMEAEAKALAAIKTITAFAVGERRVDAQGDPELTAAEMANVTKHTAEAAAAREAIEAIEHRKQVLAAAEAAAQAQVAPSASASRHSGYGEPVHAVARDRKEEGKNGFKHLGEFLHCVRAAAQTPHAVDPRLLIGAVTTGGASTYSGPDGGFLSPTTFSDGIWNGIVRDDPLNLVSRCDLRTITTRSVKFNANAETSRADGSRNGGTRAYWMEEGGSFTVSKPTYRQLEVKPKKLGAFAYMTEELMDDAPAAAQHLEQTAGEELSYVLNREIVRGNGAGKPMGIINSGGITTVAVETGQTTANPLLSANIDFMFGQILPGSLMGAVWLIHPSLQPYLQAIGREVGTGGIPAYMPPGGLSASPFGTLKGLPVLPCEYCSAANTTGDIILGNLRGYLLGMKGGTRSESSIHVAFTTDEIAFRFVIRADGQPWRASPVTLEQQAGSETYADFVLLATRSA